jgi:hypothetical protein
MTLTGSRGPAGTRHPGRTIMPCCRGSCGHRRQVRWSAGFAYFVCICGLPQGGRPKAEDDQQTLVVYSTKKTPASTAST